MAETGHAKNVANFETMISFSVGYGADYKPSNAAIEVDRLQTALAAAQTMIDGVTTGLIGWKVKVNDGETVFAGIGKFMTRFSAAFAACGAPSSAGIWGPTCVSAIFELSKRSNASLTPFLLLF